MEITIQTDVDRKYLLAFFKGLCQVKYKDLYAKLRLKQNDVVDQTMDLEFLYAQLFQPGQMSPDEFNSLVENGMRLIADLLELNPSKDALEDYLRKVNCSEETRKVIAQFWKQEVGQLLQAVKSPS